MGSPKNVEHRLATTGTMVLALAALQAFVAEDLPRAGYQTNGQWFVKISNIMMILAALESVVVYIACEKSWSVIRLFNRGWDREGALTEHEMQMWDHVFIVFYLVLYMSLTDMLFTSVQNVWEPSLIVGLATIACPSLPSRKRKLLMKDVEETPKCMRFKKTRETQTTFLRVANGEQPQAAHTL